MAKKNGDGTITINKLRKKPDLVVHKEWTDKKKSKSSTKSGSAKPKASTKKSVAGAGRKPVVAKKKVTPKKTVRHMELKSPQPKGITIKSKKPATPKIKPIAGPKKYSKKPTSSKKSKVASTKRYKKAGKSIKRMAKKTKIC